MKSISQFINERRERDKRITTAKNMIIGGNEFSSVNTFGIMTDVDESYDDELTVEKTNDITKDIKSFMKWYNDIFEGDNEVYAVKLGPKDVWALERDGEVLLYIDKNGLIYADSKLKRRCGDIYFAYDALDRYGFPAC